MKKIKSISIKKLLIILIIITSVLLFSNARKNLRYEYKEGYDMAIADCERGYKEGYTDAIYDFTYDWMPIAFCEAKQIEKYCEWLDQIKPKYLVNEDCLYYFQQKTIERAIEIIEE